MTETPQSGTLTIETGMHYAAADSQWRLMWRKLRRHRLAQVSGVILLLFYLVALHFFDRDADGSLIFAPFVYDYKVKIDPEALKRTFEVDESKKHRVTLFAKSEPYELMGFIPLSHKLIGVEKARAPFYLLGADRLGRDMLSRIIHGARISLSIGLLGVGISLFLGILIGGISGYFGGTIDMVTQRVIEFIWSMPTTPLWLGLAAAMPRDWPPLLIYFVITIILSLIGWTELARVVRGRLLALKSEDFVAAARLDGCGEMRVILRHVIPSFASHLIAAATLAIPNMILAETALSFLGLGLQAPIVSWGVLMQEAQNIRSVATAPWLLAPGLAVVIAVLSMNFFGDGLRDAADPYS
jgi:peptide/nickel transport system permease protein